MLPEKPKPTPGMSKDELQRLLQEALRQKRPRRWRLALSAILGIALVLSFLVWRFYPTGQAGPGTVVAFDDLGVAGTEVTLQGLLEAPAEEPALAGKDMVFVDGQILLVPG